MRAVQSIVNPVTFSPPTLSLNPVEFAVWARRLEEKTGVVVPDSRKLFLESRLRSRLRETGFEDFETYFVSALDGINGAAEWAVLVDRLTVHQTEFFRHAPSIALFKAEVNKCIDDCESTGSIPRFNAWSVGCSTGEEAYSMAMTADSQLRERAKRSYLGIVATDVSQPALETAKAGVYGIERMSEIPGEYRERYCHQGGKKAFSIVGSLRKRVAFGAINLLDLERVPLQRMDVIYCQNVLIYFPKSRRLEILGHLVNYLRPGGLLILGPGEIVSWKHSQLSRDGNPRVLAYRKCSYGSAQ